MGDPGQHHLHALVARAQGGAHLVEARGQLADLVAGLNRHRTRKIALANALGGGGQTFEWTGHAPGEPRRQRHDKAEAGDPT